MIEVTAYLVVFALALLGAVVFTSLVIVLPVWALIVLVLSDEEVSPQAVAGGLFFMFLYLPVCLYLVSALV